MKKIFLLYYFSFFALSAFADDLKKEKKLLIETIKANYDSWQLKQPSGIHNDSAFNWTDEAYLTSHDKSDPNSFNTEKHIFSNFTFKISNCQAIVKFQVDYQMISAFFEKKDGQWSLVCAAVIPPDL